MRAQLGSGGNTGAEEEQGVQRVQRDHDDRVEGERLLQGGGYEVEEREHGEDAHEHVVVDDARVAGEGRRDDVADECHDEQRPEELKASQLLRVVSHVRAGERRCRRGGLTARLRTCDAIVMA
jgi:hypothetical protein